MSAAEHSLEPDAAPSAPPPAARPPAVTDDDASAATLSPIAAGRARLKWWDHLVGFAIASSYVAVLVRTARNLGYARDEGFYFDAARSYARWFELLLRDRRTALTRAAIDAAWSVNHEHPSLMKSLFGISWLQLHERHRVFAEAGTAFRFPGMVMAGLCLWLVYVVGVRAYSRRAGLVAAGCLALMPRVFYHAHLDCFDVPVMFFWALVVYCYWRSLEGSIGWALLTGVAWGLALNVKFTVMQLPAIFLIHWLVVRGRDVGRETQRGGVSFPLALVTMMTVGLAVFIALWPWMWFDTIVGEGGRPGRMAEYLNFHWNHPYYNMEYFGFNYFRPPFPRSYPYVMIAFTVPAITLVLFCVGVGARFKHLLRDASPLAWLVPPVNPRLRAWNGFYRARPADDPRGTDLLFLAAGYAVLALWWKRDTPIFGGTKHWFTLYPFLALFAGAGFDACARALDRLVDKRVRPAWMPAAFLGALCLLPAWALTAHSHPFGLSNYTPLAGGAPGAADYGMNRQFWGFTTGSLVELFNREVPEGGSVYIHDTAWPSWEMLQADGRIRPDIRVAWSVGDADFAIVHHELHMNEVDFQIWQAHQRPEPFRVLTFDGVPIVTVYRNPRVERR